MKTGTVVKTAFFVASLACLMAVFAGQAFAVSFCQPVVREAAANSFWGSYADYRDRLLTVDETLVIAKPCETCQLLLDGVEASDGVSLVTPLPQELGNIPADTNVQVQLKFRIPAGVARFHSRVRVICKPEVPPQTIPQEQFSVTPSVSWANDGCPGELPPGYTPEGRLFDTAGDSYGPRSFTAILKDAEGYPVAGKAVKWSLSEGPYGGFRILSSTEATDESGQAYAVVEPPMGFICVYPFYSSGMTFVIAETEDGQSASGRFIYSRCVPHGTSPPETEPVPLKGLAAQ